MLFFSYFVEREKEGETDHTGHMIFYGVYLFLKCLKAVERMHHIINIKLLGSL